MCLPIRYPDSAFDTKKGRHGGNFSSSGSHCSKMDPWVTVLLVAPYVQWLAVSEPWTVRFMLGGSRNMLIKPVLWYDLGTEWPPEPASPVAPWFWSMSCHFQEILFCLISMTLVLLFSSKNYHNVTNHQKRTWTLNWATTSTLSISSLFLSLCVHFWPFCIDFCFSIYGAVRRELQASGFPHPGQVILRMTRRSAPSVPGSQIQSWILTGQEVVDYKLGCWSSHPCDSVDWGPSSEKGDPLWAAKTSPKKSTLGAWSFSILVCCALWYISPMRLILYIKCFTGLSTTLYFQPHPTPASPSANASLALSSKWLDRY